jgi:hypothetical protein
MAKDNKVTNLKTVAKEAPKASTVPATYLPPGALSLDLGERVVREWGEVRENEEEIKRLDAISAPKRYDTLKSLTVAFCKAATADKSINLKDFHAEDKKTVEAVKRKLEVAIGIRVVSASPDGATITPYAPWCAQYFPMPGEDKKQPEIKEKETFRGNFGAVFKKAALAAHGILAKNITVTEDSSGFLKLEGKAVQQHFNADSVLLNEKKDVVIGTDSSGKKRTHTLKATPSYTELGRLSAMEVGKELRTRGQTGMSFTSIQGGATDEDMLKAIASFQSAIAKIQKPSDALKTALKGLQNTIATLIK